MEKFPDAAPDVWNNMQAGLAGDSVEQCIEKQQAQETPPTGRSRRLRPRSASSTSPCSRPSWAPCRVVHLRRPATPWATRISTQWQMYLASPSKSL
eukprot:2427186-Pyramimonas_sp.AAC.1